MQGHRSEAKSLRNREGCILCRYISQETCRFVGTELKNSGHEVLIVLFSGFRQGGLFAMPSACAEAFLLYLRFIPFSERIELK